MRTRGASDTLYVAHGISQKVAHGLSEEKFARTPAAVLCDGRLSFVALVIYGVLAMSTRNGGVAKSGQREIARQIGCVRNTVTAGLAELKQNGQLTIKGSGRQRKTYRLTSEVFQSRSYIPESAGEVIELYESGGVPHKRLLVDRPVVSRPRAKASQC